MPGLHTELIWWKGRQQNFSWDPHSLELIERYTERLKLDSSFGVVYFNVIFWKQSTASGEIMTVSFCCKINHKMLSFACTSVESWGFTVYSACAEVSTFIRTFQNCTSLHHSQGHMLWGKNIYISTSTNNKYCSNGHILGNWWHSIL